MTRTRATYGSTAFFIKHDPSGKEFLFFGDVEPDLISAAPRNIEVWQAAAPKVPHILDTIFIECSYPLGRRDDQLYGHLNPEHLITELCILAQEVVKVRRGEYSRPMTQEERTKRWQHREPLHFAFDELHGALSGVRLYITHCKDDLAGQYQEPISTVIAGQVRALVEQKALGLQIVAARQGMHIGG